MFFSCSQSTDGELKVSIMSLSLIIIEQFREIMEKLYEKEKEIEKGNIKEPYYQKTLAKAISKSEQAISDSVKNLVKIGMIKTEEKAGPSKGKAKYLRLTEEGLLSWMVLTPPNIKNINRAIRKLYIELEEIPSLKIIREELEVSIHEKEYVIMIDKILAKFKKNIKTLEDIIEEIIKEKKLVGLKLGKERKEIIKIVNEKQNSKGIKEPENIIKLLLKKYEEGKTFSA